jgi:tetratricopeptide (TPR) repeat protein
MKLAFLLAVLSLSLIAQSPAALSEQAQELAQQKRFAEAERLWREALGRDPDFFPSLFNLGFMHFSNGRPAEARPWLERAAKVSPQDFNSHYLLGSVLLQLQDRDGALRAWRRALRLQPNNLKLMQVMVVEYEKGLYYGEAEALARRALEQNPADLNLSLLAIHACQNARDLSIGLEIARHAAERFPDSSRANFEYGFHLQRAGLTAEAVDYLKRAMKLDPKYEEPLFFYGDLLVTEGRDAAALTYLKQAISLRADYLPPRLSLARALMHLELWPESFAELEAAARIDPGHPEPHLLLSRVYFRTGDEERAAREKEISLRLRHDNPNKMEATQGRPFPE